MKIARPRAPSKIAPAGESRADGDSGNAQAGAARRRKKKKREKNRLRRADWGERAPARTAPKG